MNENLLGDMARAIWAQSPLWAVPEKSLDRLDLRVKLVIVPQVLFGTSFVAGAQPYQDFALLVKVRNDIVHWKMANTAPTYIGALTTRGIALTHPGGNADYTWTQKLHCTEGIRWAHNSACAVVARLVEFTPEDGRHFLEHLAGNFPPIEEQKVAAWFQTNLPAQQPAPK